MKTVSEIIDQDFVNLSIEYAKSYKENPKAFLSSYKKYESVRSSCQMIISTYKRIGAYEPKKDFSEYAKKFYSGEDARIFSEILSIIHSIIIQ